MPAVGCIAGGTVALLIICVVGPPLQYLSVDRYNASPQAIVVFVTAAGSLGCLATCLAIPHLTRRLSSRGRAVKVLKRMNLLGLVRPKMHPAWSVTGCHTLSMPALHVACGPCFTRFTQHWIYVQCVSPVTPCASCACCP